MPRLNLSITQEMYDNLEKAAENNNTTINMLVLNVLESMYAEKVTYDYSIALQSLIEESMRMETEFTLADLPTFANIEVTTMDNGYLKPATVRARLGKMYNEAVRNGKIQNVERAVIEKNGKEELKFISRAAVYLKKMEGKKRYEL